MKTKFIILVLLIACFSCRTNKSVSDAEKEKIKGEVKEVADAMFKGCEEANFEMATESFLDSPDFVMIFNGVSLNYKGVVDAIKPLFSTLINQKVTIIDEKYVFLDKSTVIYAANCKFLENYKDGHAVLSDPMVVQITCKKIDNKWKTINGVESSVRQDVKNIETSNELNQVELFKQFTGIFKAVEGGDTTFIWEGKSYGNGLDVNVKYVTKEKTISEGKAVLGYNKEIDKYIQTRIMKGAGSMVGVMWFTSKNICKGISIESISNPESAPFTFLFEFQSPTKAIQTIKVSGKPNVIQTFTIQR
jgi:hypothetical protein